MVNVKITGLREAGLLFRTETGQESVRPMDQVDYMQITGWALFNMAEKQQQSGELRRAAANYEKALAEARSAATAGSVAHAGKVTSGGGPQGAGPRLDRLDRVLLLECRLLSAYQAQRQFDRAVGLYLEVIEGHPEYLDILRPTSLPAKGSLLLASASDQVNAAIERHGRDRIAESLDRWRQTWPTEGSEPGAAAKPGESAGRPTAEVAANPKAQAALSAIRSLVEAKRFDEALAHLGSERTGWAGLPRADAYYWRGRALVGKSAAQHEPAAADRDRRRAGLAFMRVVISFPDHPLAPECLYRAAELCGRMGPSAQAATLWSELVAAHPTAAPWAERARNELKALALTSRPGS